MLRIDAWNINGLTPSTHELVAFISNNKLNVVLIFKSHVITQSCINEGPKDISTTEQKESGLMP